jgi:hypothetical protein
VQYSNMENFQDGEGTAWIIEGSADYFSNVVFPTGELERDYAPFYDPALPIYENNEYSTSIFFQSLEPSEGIVSINEWVLSTPGDDGLLPVDAERARLSNLPDFTKKFYNFAKQYSFGYGTIKDTSGEFVPIVTVPTANPTQISWDASGKSGNVKLTTRPFSITEYEVTLEGGQTVSVYSSAKGNQHVAYRTYSDLVWTDMSDTPVSSAQGPVVLPCSNGNPVKLLLLFVSGEDTDYDEVTVFFNQDNKNENCNRKIGVAIDSSGSNQETDPNNLRIAAGQAFVSTLDPDDRVTIIDFDSSARIVYPLGDPAAATFDGIDSEGGTLIGLGVDLAITEITQDGSAPHDNAGVVVLSDGLDNDPSFLTAALARAKSLGVRASWGFLSPPVNPIPRRLARGLVARQLDDPVIPEISLLEAILNTGGVFGVIDSPEAQESFIELIIARGVTNIDNPGSNIGGPLSQGVTIYSLAAGEADVYTYRATSGQDLTFEIQSITGLELKAVLLAGSGEVANVLTDGEGKITIPYKPPSDVDLKLTVSGADGGDLTGVYSVKLIVSGKPNPNPSTCNIPNGSPCNPLGKLECCGTGFVICDHNGTVYFDCGPGTVCRPGNPGAVYCGWP